MASILVVEDGTGTIASANTYITVVEADTFCSQRGLTDWATLSTANKEIAIIRGMGYVETFDFKGIKMSWQDPLEWPRYGVWDESFQGNMTDLSSEELAFYQEVPPGVKKAACQAAYEEAISPGVLQPAGQSNIQSETIDVISVSYFRDKPSQPVYPNIEGFLKGLLNNKNVANIRRC